MTIALLLLAACTGAPPSTSPSASPEPSVSPGLSASPSPVPPPAWPAPGAVLRVLPSGPVPGDLLLDAGHGAPRNPGNTNWRCRSEGDVMRALADRVAAALPTTPDHPVRRTRPDARLVAYPDRLAMSRTATWLVSLHSDVRAGRDVAQDPTTGCWTNEGAQGFSVLWSDEGPADLVAARHALAVAIAARMVEAGFPAYDGVDYAGLYAPEAAPGVYVDRHDDRHRIMLLRRPVVPSVIVETHEAWDREEADRWEEPATATAFASALGAALGDVAGR